MEAATPAVTQIRDSGRVPEIDALRFIAATAVVLYHFTYLPRVAGVTSPTAFGSLQSVTRFGYLGVNLFFIISGFVILWSAYARTTGEFVISRLARLYPSFWVCVLLTALVARLASTDAISLRQLLANLTMVPGAVGIDYIDGVYWTLFVELKFYLLVLLCLATGTMKHIEVWLAVWLACCIGNWAHAVPHIVASATVSPYGPYFISGCLLYMVRSRGVSALRFLMLAVSCALCMAVAVDQQAEFMKSVTPTSTVVVVSAVVVFHLALIGIALIPRILPESRNWYLLGAVTYPLYLLHSRIGKVVWASVQRSAPLAVALFVSLAVVYLLAWVVSALVERRLSKSVHRTLLRYARRSRLVPAQ